MISLKELYENFMRHTHTLTSLGAAPASHTHTLQSLGAAAADHTHTAASLGAAPASHTHTLQSLGAAAANHTHSPQSLGLGLQMIADGGGGPSIRVDVSGKTLAVLYITTIDRRSWYPVTFAIQEWALGANLLDHGTDGQLIYDALVDLALNGTTLTITRSNSGPTVRLGRLYVM